MTLVCPKCFEDSGLKKRIEEIRPEYPSEKCTFHPRYKGIPLKDVAEIIDEVFRAHYGIGDYHHHYLDSQDGDPLELVIGEMILADEEIIQAVVNQLIEDENCFPQDGDEPFYDNTQSYVRHEEFQEYHSRLWKEFCESIVHSQRFFNLEARGLISEIFDGLQHQRDHRKRPPVYEIKPGDKHAVFFRARISNDAGKRKKIAKNPQKELGPPPKRMRNAGRMNSAGISCFYGAFDLKTCISELRPIVGNVIMGVKFEIARPIYVLDTTRFEAPIKPISIFSTNHIERVEQWNFMQKFRFEIAKPISPDDEHLDYIPTQAVAEYLLYHHNFKRNGKTAKIEAIIYRSAQNPAGKNIVLLGDAAVVKKTEQELQKKMEIYKKHDPFRMESVFSSKWRGVKKNPGIRLVEKTIKTLRIRSAEYAEVPYSEYHDDCPEFDL